MKQCLTVASGKENELQWMYSQDWVYRDYGSCKRHLQILFPYRRDMPGDERYPLILFIPGSAWHKQEMYNGIPQYARLAERGFVVAAMEYRESDIAAFPAQVEDVCSALAFIPSIADNFHIDLNRIFLMGNSSGGHIAMMAALFNAHGLCGPMPKLSGVISESGSTDLLLCAKDPLPPWMTVRPSAVLLGVDRIEGNEDAARKASCAAYITESVELPPVLLLHSEYDPIVSVENSQTLYDKLTETGHEVWFFEIRGNADHGGATFYDGKVLDIVQTFCEKYSV